MKNGEEGDSIEDKDVEGIEEKEVKEQEGKDRAVWDENNNEL